MNLKQLGIKMVYEDLKLSGDRIALLKDAVDWESFRGSLPVEDLMGRHRYDPVMMLKIIILQALYDLSDREAEVQIKDRVSFMNFLDFPDKTPDETTIWRFKEGLSGTEHDKIWKEFERQLADKGIVYSKGSVQDATFIEANPGKTQSGMDNRGRGQSSTRVEDGDWGKKGNKSVFGYKAHGKIELGNGFITNFAATPASTHDSRIDLTKPDDVVYLDKGYSGINFKAKHQYVMKKKPKGKELTEKEKKFNKKVSSQRAPGERPFAVIKRVFKKTFTRVTELHRVFTQISISFLLHNILILRKKT